MLLHLWRNLAQIPHRATRNSQPSRVIPEHKPLFPNQLRSRHRSATRKCQRRLPRPRRQRRLRTNRVRAPIDRMPHHRHIIQPVPAATARNPSPSTRRTERPTSRVIWQPSPRIRRHPRVPRTRIPRPQSIRIRIPRRTYKVRLPHHPAPTYIGKTAIVVQVADSVPR
jgi:hypothetical protein